MARPDRDGDTDTIGAGSVGEDAADVAATAIGRSAGDRSEAVGATLEAQVAEEREDDSLLVVNHSIIGQSDGARSAEVGDALDEECIVSAPASDQHRTHVVGERAMDLISDMLDDGAKEVGGRDVGRE